MPSFIHKLAVTALSLTPVAASYGQDVYEATVPLPDYSNLCASQVLVNQSFADSFGKPAVINYEPPAECADFTHVTAELHLTIFGYQYDRLMHLEKDGIEVWRPSTPEPVGHKVHSTNDKDLSRFVNLFKYAGEMRFSLANELAATINGIYHAELVLNFYDGPAAETGVSDTDWFYSNDAPATNFYSLISNEVDIYKTAATAQIPQLSQNTTRAVLNVYASGNSNEEFWYAGDFSTDGPTRLVEVYVDGKLAGVADPFPVVYTGGIDPGLWQPLMGLRSADVPNYIVDVTPFLPLLWENAETSLEIAVGNGYSSDPEDILSDWIIDVSLLTWQSDGIEGSGQFNYATQQANGEPHNYTYAGSVENFSADYYHQVEISADLSFFHSLSGTNYSGNALWTQSAAMTNYQNDTSTLQYVHQQGTGSSKYQWSPFNTTTSQSSNSTLASPATFVRDHYYPLHMNEVSFPNNSLSSLSIDRGYNVNITSVDGIYNVSISQDSNLANKTFYSETNITATDFYRQAIAYNGTIVKDTYN